MPKIITQGKKALVEIIGPEVGITWNLAGWSETASWAIVITLPQGTPENGKFLHLGSKDCNFSVYNNYCFLNNFLFKSQNKVPTCFEITLKVSRLWFCI